jgi:hypothetical protein
VLRAAALDRELNQMMFPLADKVERIDNHAFVLLPAEAISIHY